MALRLVRRPDQQIVITHIKTGVRCVISPPLRSNEVNTSIGFTADRNEFLIAREIISQATEEAVPA